MQVLTSDEVTKEVSFRKQPLDRGLLLVLRVSEVRREGLSKLSEMTMCSLLTKHIALLLNVVWSVLRRCYIG